MIGRLGPRRLAYTTADGATGEIEVTIEGLGLNRIDLGDDVFIERVRARVTMVSKWLNKQMEADGDDDLQVIFRLIRISDIYIQQICHECGASVETYKEGSLISDFGTFR